MNNIEAIREALEDGRASLCDDWKGDVPTCLADRYSKGFAALSALTQPQPEAREEDIEALQEALAEGRPAMLGETYDAALAALSRLAAKEGQGDDELTELWAVVMEAIVEIDHGHPMLARDMLVSAYDDGLPFKTSQPVAPATSEKPEEER